MDSRRGCVAACLLAAGSLLPLREWLAAFGKWLTGLGPAGYVLYAAAYVRRDAAADAGRSPDDRRGLSVRSAAGRRRRLRRARRRARPPRSWWHGTSRATASPDTPRATLARGRRPGGRPEKGWRIVFLLRLSPVVPFVRLELLLRTHGHPLLAVRVRELGRDAAADVRLRVSLGVAGRRAAHMTGRAAARHGVGRSWRRAFSSLSRRPSTRADRAKSAADPKAGRRRPPAAVGASVFRRKSHLDFCFRGPEHLKYIADTRHGPDFPSQHEHDLARVGLRSRVLRRPAASGSSTP